MKSVVHTKTTTLGAVALLGLSLTACQRHSAPDFSGPVAGWPQATGSGGGGQYSPLTQINRSNVGDLQVAWTYDASDPSPAGPATSDPATALGGGHASTAFETTPILVGNKLLLCTAAHRVIALDAQTGKELWTFDPRMDLATTPSRFCRGVSSWSEPEPVQGRACQHRVLGTSGDGRLFALDLDNGKPCEDFGTHGIVDVREHMGEVRPGELYLTAPPFMVQNLAVLGGSIHDGYRLDAPGGVVRAFDVHTGQVVWAFDPVGPGMTPVTAQDAANGATYTRGTPNVWSFMSADADNGLLYLPMGNAQSDFFKGPERAIDYYGSAVVALKIKTGEVAWFFRTVNHDIWDYDIAAQPVLYQHQGKIPALAVATKSGNVFLLNRLTGEPLFPIEQRRVPITDVPGEWSAPTQPFPTLPKPLAPATINESDVLNYPYFSRGCRDLFRASRDEGIYTPPSLRGTLQSPAVSGGFNWGSNSVNTDKGVFVGAYLNMPFVIRMVPRSKPDDGANQPVPSGFADAPQYGTPYSVDRFPFLSATGIPCVKPPWGSLIAIDLNSGKELWRRALGSLYGRVPLIGAWLTVGAPVSGGVMQTASGLVFVGATIDEHLRAFDAESGKTLWSTKLPYSAHSIPMTYRLERNSKQFLVVAAGGALGLDQHVGHTVVAFTLPDGN